MLLRANQVDTLRVAVISAVLIVTAVFAWTGLWQVLFAPLLLCYAYVAFTNWRAAWWLLLAFIPLSIQINFAGDTLSITLPDEPMMWILLLLVMAGLAYRPESLQRSWWQHSIVQIVLLQFVWMLVATIFSKVPFYSFKFCIAKTWQLVCMFLCPIWILKTRKDFEQAFRLLLFPMVFTIVVILLHHALLGFRFDRVQQAMSGLYYNHVDYSTVISVFFPLLLVAMPFTGKFQKLLWGVVIVFILGIFLSFARAAVIAVAFALLIGFCIRYRLVNFVMPTIYIGIICLLAYLSYNNKYLDYRPDINRTYMHASFTEHMTATLRGNDMSSMERVYRWIAAIRMSRDRPITGYGPHGFYYYYKPYAVPSFKTWVSENREHSTTHNYYLYMLTEQGWPAMLLYALLIPVIFATCQRLYHRCKDPFYKACILGIGMMIGASFINNFFSELLETHKVGALFYVPLAALVVIQEKMRRGALD